MSNFYQKAGAFTLLLLSFNFYQSKAQLVSGDLFLKGKYVEVGIGPNGTFGSRYDAPAGYHGRSYSSDAPAAAIGFVADPDKDGWTVAPTGGRAYYGDYFLPEAAYEAWGLEVNGRKYYTDRSTAGGGSATFFTSGLTGSNTGYFSTGSQVHGIWEGTAGSMSIKQDTYIDTNALYFVVRVQLKNTGDTALNDVFYSQAVNPDNDYNSTTDTKDSIIYQLPNAENKTLVIARGVVKRAYLGLGSKDCRAKVFRFESAWSPMQISAFSAITLKKVYNQTVASSLYKYSGSTPGPITSFSDNFSIGIVFNVGTIAPGDSTSISYTYILKQGDLDSALRQTSPFWQSGTASYQSGDTIRACRGTSIPVAISGGESFAWGAWSTSFGLSASSGRTNTITVQDTATTYMIPGSSGDCSNDTIYLTVAPIMPFTSAPIVSSPVAYCNGATATTLSATGTNLKWYTAATGGTGSTIAPTPSTTTAGNYYVSQTTDSASGGCEGPRATIAVSINALPVAPTVVSPLNLCQAATASALSATGTSLKWYTTATGGTGSSSAPSPSTASTGTTTYYVSQTSAASAGSCEGTARASIDVTVNALPAAPTATSPVSYCQNAAALALSASGSNLKWYTVATGGTGSTTAPIPSTTSSGAFNYYVSQTSAASAGSCEGSRATVSVTINALPAAPTVTSPVNYCIGAAATTLSATGTSLLWYISASGGTGNSIAPTPSTIASGTTNYYVSQTSSTTFCESPRSLVAVTVNTNPAAPTVVSPNNICIGSTTTALTASGTGLKWYTTASGGSASTTPPVPSSATLGTNTYYVSQTTAASCESPRSAMIVTVQPLPIVSISSLSPYGFIFCKNLSVTLQATAPTATAYQWKYASADVSGATNDTVWANKTGVWGITVTDVYGCIGQAVVAVRQDTTALPTLSPTSVIICQESTALLTCNPGFVSYTFQWMKDGMPVLPATPTANLKNANDTGVYTVIVTNNYGCIDTTNASVLSHYPKPIKPVIGYTKPVLSVAGGYLYYQWYRNGKVIVGANKNKYTISADGSYYVEVTDANGCLNQSDTLSITQSTGIGNSIAKTELKVFPNPTSNFVNIEAPIKVNVLVTNMVGQQILLQKNAISIDLSNYADATYFFRIMDEENNLISVEKISKLAN